MRRLSHARVHPLTTVIIFFVLALSPYVVSQRLAGSAAAATGSIAFGTTTVVDDQRAAGEPDVKVCGPSATWSYGNCGQNNPYGSAPWGFSTTSSFVWRSEDQARTFKLVPSNNTTGKPDACPGGGDTDLAVSPGATQASDFLDFIDLQALTNFSDGVSSNGGQLWACNAASSFATAVDRQWFGVYKNPAGAPANGSRVYLDYDIAAGSALPTPNCLLNATSNGNAFVVQSSIDGGLTYAPPSIVDCNDGIAGNMQVNQTTSRVFAIHTAYSTPTGAVSDQVAINSSANQGATWDRHVIFQCTPAAECTVGQDFAVLAIDKAGGLYAVWSQAPTDSAGNVTGPSHIFYSYSGDDGATWTPEKQIDHGSTNINVFPWIAAGNSGAIDVVWYGTNNPACSSNPNTANCDPGKQTGNWFPYLSQSLNANGTAGSFSVPVPVSDHPNHNGGICTMGLGCTTGGDRSLADYFQVDINKQGGADVIWADTSNNGSNGNNQGALIDEARQLSGPTLYGTTLSGSRVICRAVTATPCQRDQTGDAKYEANGVIGPNVPKLDITGSSVNINPSNTSQLDVRMNIANLSSLTTAGDLGVFDTHLDFLTSWNYHKPGGTQATFDSTGNIYYAYLEVAPGATGSPLTAFDGNTCSVATTHPKYLVYPGQHAVSYRVNYATGTIDLFVPRSDVGNPGIGSTLYSVAAHTVGQAGPAGPYDCTTRDPNGNNQDPTGKVFNIYDKSPAYTSILTSPSTTGGGGGGGGTGGGCDENADSQKAESDALAHMNQQRALAGLPALSMDPMLSAEARNHSCDESHHGSVSQTGSDGSSPSDRTATAGIPFVTSAENVGSGSGLLPSLALNAAETGILANPTSRANIFNPVFSQVGIGAVYANGRMWLTEDFID